MLKHSHNSLMRFATRLTRLSEECKPAKNTIRIYSDRHMPNFHCLMSVVPIADTESNEAYQNDSGMVSIHTAI